MLKSIEFTAKDIVQTLYHMFTKEGISPSVVALFRKIIYDFYTASGRDLPWRRTDNPFLILVSEIMLQQTQVERVLPKYILFTETFPDLYSLAEAPTRKIVELWQGLGYNRRALSLQQCAKIICNEFKGEIPSQEDTLMQLPGIGKATASEIAAFAFNRPTVFIETNIRTVFLFFFFKDDTAVKDSQLLPLIEKTLDYSHPRSWYYALMDYGVYLKKSGVTNNKQSAHYAKQSPFQGSNRQIRGMILKHLLAYPGSSGQDIAAGIKRDYTVIKKNLTQLQKEGFITAKNRRYVIVE